MRLVLQRVTRASVSVDEKIVGNIPHGFLVLLGVAKGDTEHDADVLLEKLLKLRLFPDAEKSDSFMEKNLIDIGGSLLVVSQFTLYGDTSKGTRPSFTDSAPAAEANTLYEYFVAQAQKQRIPVETGVFGAHMEVSLVNDGPITLIIDSR